VTTRRLAWPLLTALILAIAVAGAASAVFEEVESYNSLADMTRAADAVVLGRVVSAERGRLWQDGCGNTAADLEVESVLAARDVEVPTTIMLE
jgi:hypothetical protein